jgi:hypothetical protein
LVHRTHLDLASGLQEGVEADDEVGVAREEGGHAGDGAGRVHGLPLEVAHDVEEVGEDPRPVAELVPHAVQVRGCVFALK